MLSEITLVLSPTIYASTILIAEQGGGHMPKLSEPTGASSSTAGGLKHVIIIHVVAKCKRSVVVDPGVPYTSYLELLKLCNLQ